ncbi:hypothetical protein [Aquimarina algiphila]|uniref:hypothetical protein n=1 Tax=Aquimarina algiphila TaxID=2047982 RepID=UPI00232EB8B9|nr:hypothetical protein [Aquimarina algiphila]
MLKKEVDVLLNALDESVNSNSYWITLSINENENQFIDDVLQHLKTGSFHFELVKQDLTRGYNEYSEIVFPKCFENPVFIQKPGNVWNGNEMLNIEVISKKMVEDLLMDMLTGKQKYFSKSYLGTPFCNDEAKSIVHHFFKVLNDFGNWTSYNILPNFLNTIDDYYTSNHIKLGYFERCNKDLVLIFKYTHEVNILLINGSE